VLLLTHTIGIDVSIQFLRYHDSSCSLSKYLRNSHVRERKLGGAIESLLNPMITVTKEASDKLLELIRNIIVDAPIEPLLANVIERFLSSLPSSRSTTTIAVRSSSTMEDQSGVSYAGQYDTYLNVPPTSEAVGHAIKMVRYLIIKSTYIC
jgi:phosphoenolpyruvate synthase/pyruvate phosphate dikinase